MKESTFVKTYFWKNLECELCKTVFPHTIKARKVDLKVIEYDVPPKEDVYMILESISSNTSKVIHVVNFTNCSMIKLGRGHDADVRVTDISVSRFHASIKKSPNGLFYIEDNNSKFGTLLLVRIPMKISN